MTRAGIKRQFGKAIRLRRGHLGITQEELAERAGLHRSYIADVERGVRNPSLVAIAKLAGGLGVSVATLLALAERLPGAPADQPALAAAEGPAEILLIEDDQHDAELTQHAFERAGILNPVRVIRAGQEALDFLFGTGAHSGLKGATLPQIILLDLRLPRLPGLEVLRRLKADARTRHIPVAVLTGSQRDRDIAESKRLGAAAYILKPVDFYRFTKVVPELNASWALLSPTGKY
jgi:CheY-like chemotaxis protein/DNA-binding XRE family transcriptional regulator